MVIVVDDADRENEGDLDHGRATRHARRRQFHGQARARIDLRADTSPNACSNSASSAWSGRTAKVSAPIFKSAWTPRAASRTGISAADRAKTIQIMADADRRAGRFGPARPCFSAARAARRRVAARRPHRSRRGFGHACRLPSHRRALRNLERRRHDGAPAAAFEIREEAQIENLHHRRSDSNSAARAKNSSNRSKS